MDYAVVGGDARFAYLTRLLDSCGRDARAVNGAKCGVNVLTAEFDELKQAKNVVMNWPDPDGERILEMLSPGTRKDERLLTDNAWLTAEGAVSAAMSAGNASLKDCRCLVVGWGRIGKALTELLIGMHAKVTVASRSDKGRNCAAERGADVVSTYRLAEAAGGKEIIFSTPPERVFTEIELKHADPGTMVIDLSSAPFGVDLEAARRLNLRAWREPKLPGRYCPFSAARALLQAILRAERMNADE